MRIATLARAGSTSACVVAGATAVPIPAAADVGALLADPGWRARAERALADGLDAVPLDGATLLRPVLAPAATVCVGANYVAHIVEMGRERPTAPTLFSKLPGSLTDPEATIAACDRSAALDYEGELVVVIGREARDVAVEDALDHVAGYTLMNDTSARDLQNRSAQWFAGKNLERATPVGPWLATADEVGDLGARTIETRVNGEVRQRSSVTDLCFDVPFLVADISRLFTLRPGDLIATGTPGGVGHARTPKAYLVPGDVVEVEVDGIGVLRSRFA